MAAVGAPPFFHVAAAAMSYFTSGQGSTSPSASIPMTVTGGSSHAELPALPPPLDISEFILPEDIDAFLPPPPMAVPAQVPAAYYETGAASAVASPMADAGNSSSVSVSSGSAGVGVEGPRGEEATRIAFRMKSEVEIVDDGFKWRKYGKKSVKNSPNPRNYYRCSTEGCSVKKRVERDREDPSYVITTYEGIHNHMSPGVVYYTTKDRITGQYYVAGCEIPPPATSSSS